MTAEVDHLRGSVVRPVTPSTLRASTIAKVPRSPRGDAVIRAYQNAGMAYDVFAIGLVITTPADRTRCPCRLLEASAPIGTSCALAQRVKSCDARRGGARSPALPATGPRPPSQSRTGKYWGSPDPTPMRAQRNTGSWLSTRKPHAPSRLVSTVSIGSKPSQPHRKKKPQVLGDAHRQHHRYAEAADERAQSQRLR
jgi:hypothetical protein